MRIHFQSDGGIAYFPGLNKPIDVDTASLPPQSAAELERLVGAARFFTQPARVGVANPGAADYRTYTISVEDSGRSHTIQVIEPIQDPSLQALIDRLRTFNTGPP